VAPRSTSVSRSPSSPEKTLRRTVSIAAFPQPPKAGGLSSTASSSMSLSQLAVSKSRSPDLTKMTMAASNLRTKKASRSSNVNANTLKGPKAPGLLNSSGDGKSQPNASNTRNSEGHFSIPSPPQSRSSSAQGSYSTSATTCDDLEDGARRGREVADDIPGNGRGSSTTKEGKGNVLVSVRIRPDTAGADHSKSEGEWIVDGRRSLVSYRGKEGGDYYYGNIQT
jgi:centromeric protein E